MDNTKAVTTGGWSLIAFTITYFGLLLYLTISFTYPALLTWPTEQALPALISGGRHLQTALTLLALTPLLLVPASLGVYHAFKDTCKISMRVALIFALIGIVGLILCLLQWPSMHWQIANFYVKAAANQQEVIRAILIGFNAYLSIFVGEFISKTCIILWTGLVAHTIIKDKQLPKWIGYFGWLTAIYLLITWLGNFGIFDLGTMTIIHTFMPIEPIWLFILGTGLLVYKR